MNASEARKYYKDRRPEDWYSSPEPDVAQWRRPNKTNLSSVFHVPAYFDVMRAIDVSRRLLEQPAGWDEAENQPLEEATWLRATEFLLRHARRLHERHSICLPAPHIGLGPDGSVDLHWKTERRELLLNVPSGDQRATFYGDSYGGNTIKGQVDTRILDLGLFTWLTITD
jgi:hypothetical protein